MPIGTVEPPRAGVTTGGLCLGYCLPMERSTFGHPDLFAIYTNGLLLFDILGNIRHIGVRDEVWISPRLPSGRLTNAP